MRTTVDIPDALYRELKSRAASEGTTVKQLILHSVLATIRPGSSGASRKRVGLAPVIQSKNPGSLRLGPEGVYEYIPFP
jgi:hypothetical protein